MLLARLIAAGPRNVNRRENSAAINIYRDKHHDFAQPGVVTH